MKGSKIIQITIILLFVLKCEISLGQKITINNLTWMYQRK
jgi:hypothetical protein